jgi:hypothetical protein
LRKQIVGGSMRGNVGKQEQQKDRCIVALSFHPVLWKPPVEALHAGSSLFIDRKTHRKENKAHENRRRLKFKYPTLKNLSPDGTAITYKQEI